MGQRTHKSCTKCGESKAPSAFTARSSAKDGLQSRCKPCIAADKAAVYEREREKILAANRARYAADPSRAKAYAANWKAANKDKAREYRRLNYVRNRERVAETTRAWRAANPDKLADYWLRRRARVKNATVGDVDLSALWDAQDGRCALCGQPIDRSLRFPHPMSPSVDHILPLSKGGTHEQSNLQWTHLVGNQQKGASVPAHRPS